MEDFYVGDTIRLKTIDELIEEYGQDSAGMPNVIAGYTPDMTYMGGQIATIKRIDGEGFTTRFRTEENIEGKDYGRFHWKISVDMIEHYDTSLEDPITVDLSQFFT